MAHSGSVGLLWRRLQARAELPASPLIESVHECYRQQVIDAALWSKDLARLLTACQKSGISPVVIKGWAAARSYPAPGLRPYSDIDLIIEPSQKQALRQVLAGLNSITVDIHLGFSAVNGLSPAAIRPRLRRFPLGDVEVTVLGAEDHLRHLCLHFLIHGAWRTVGLCDIALELEKCGADFDWDYFLAATKPHAQAITCTVGLAGRVLDANLAHAPLAHAADNLPSWMVPSLLEQWGRDYQVYPQIKRPSWKPRELIAQAMERWPNPIRATFALGGPYNELPRWPVQAAAYLLRCGEFLRDWVGRETNR